MDGECPLQEYPAGKPPAEAEQKPTNSCVIIFPYSFPSYRTHRCWRAREAQLDPELNVPPRPEAALVAPPAAGGTGADRRISFAR